MDKARINKLLLTILAVLAASVWLAAPVPAAACTAELLPYQLYSSYVDEGVLPPSITIGVEQELSTWLDGTDLKSFDLEWQNHEWDQPFVDVSLGYQDTPIFGVKNLTASPIFVIKKMNTKETPEPSTISLPAGRTVAYVIAPHTAVAFRFDPGEHIIENFRDLSPRDVDSSVDTDARMYLYIGRELVTVDFTVTIAGNPEAFELDRAMQECQDMIMQDSNPSLYEQLEKATGSASVRLSPGATVAIGGAFLVVGILAVLGIVVVVRRGRDSR